MRGGRGIRVVDESDDTLTESCEGAVNFMVVEMKDKSLHQVHLGEVVNVVCGLRRPKVGTTNYFRSACKRDKESPELRRATSFGIYI